MKPTHTLSLKHTQTPGNTHKHKHTHKTHAHTTYICKNSYAQSEKKSTRFNLEKRQHAYL